MQALRFARALHAGAARWAATKVNMPAMSPTMTEGVVVRWAKKEGDMVNPGDVLLEIQTDKATIDVESNEGGVLAKILVPAGSPPVAVNTPIAVMVEEGEDWRNVQVPADAAAPATPTQATPTPVPAAAPPQKHAKPAGPLFPSVALLLETHGLRAEDVPGSGPKGRLLKGDVLAYLERRGAAAAPPPPAPAKAAPPTASAAAALKTAPPSATTEYETVPLTNMRRTIARRLTESKFEVPHYYTSRDIDMTAASRLRDELNRTLAATSTGDDKVKLSFNDFVLKAAAVALREVPEVNAVWTPEGLKQQADVDIAVAVAIDNGLITPVVRGVDRLGLVEISRSVKALAAKARANKLAPHEYQGGTFSVSNLGMFGISHFTAVINPPQVAILAVSSTRDELPRAVVDESPRQDAGASAASPLLQPQHSRPVMTVTLSADARAVDPDVAARFVSVFKEALEGGLLTA